MDPFGQLGHLGGVNGEGVVGEVVEQHVGTEKNCEDCACEVLETGGDVPVAGGANKI